MWYAVETAFVDGKHLESKPCFDMNVDPNCRRAQPGTCHRSHDDEPYNSCETFMDGRIEIHTDWFQTKEQAMKFCDGSLTYIVHQDAHYRKSINSTILSFMRWEAVPVTGDMQPFRGIYQKHMR